MPGVGTALMTGDPRRSLQRVGAEPRFGGEAVECDSVSGVRPGLAFVASSRCDLEARIFIIKWDGERSTSEGS